MPVSAASPLPPSEALALESLITPTAQGILAFGEESGNRPDYFLELGLIGRQLEQRGKPFERISEDVRLGERVLITEVVIVDEGRVGVQLFTVLMEEIVG